MNNDARARLAALDEYTSVHYRTLVCWLLDPSQPASPHGEYNPRRITPAVAKLLLSHKLAPEFIRIVYDEITSEPTLWLRENYDSHYEHWRAKHALSDSERVARIAENEHMKRAVANFIAYERKHNRRTRDEVLFEMVMTMIASYKEDGETSPYVKMLTQIGYITT